MVAVGKGCTTLNLTSASVCRLQQYNEENWSRRYAELSNLSLRYMVQGNIYFFFQEFYKIDKYRRNAEVSNIEEGYVRRRISGGHRGVNEICTLLGFYAA